MLDTTLSFTAPFVAFLPAEAIGASGVLAVVVTGLLLGHKAPTLQSAASRLAETTNWSTVQFMLENAVFLLIGLQIRPILEAVGDSDLGVGRIALICAVVLVVTILVRIAYTMAAVWIYHHGTARMRAHAWSWAAGAVVSWAGMRGVVTLAAAFLLPEETPQREVLQLAAFVVVAGTLLHSGDDPAVARRAACACRPRARPRTPSRRPPSSARRRGRGWRGSRRSARPATPRRSSTSSASAPSSGPTASGSASAAARPRSSRPRPPTGACASRCSAPSGTSIVHARDAGYVDDDVLRAAMTAVDLEESLLDPVEDAESMTDRELRPTAIRAGDCEHLREAPAGWPPARRTGARSACATASPGCTCACA